jgi:hypothetical protein
MSTIKLSGYTDIEAHPKLAAVLLEMMKRLESKYTSLAKTPRIKHVFRGLSVPDVTFDDICEAALCSSNLIQVIANAEHYIVSLDYRWLDHSGLFILLESAVKPQPTLWEVWVKMAELLARNEGKIYSDSHLTDLCHGPVNMAYTQFQNNNPYVHKLLKESGAYYVYLKPR